MSRQPNGLATSGIQFIGQCLDPIDPPGAQHNYRALCRKPASRRLTKPTAGAGDDDNFPFNVAIKTTQKYPTRGPGVNDNQSKN